MTRFFVSYSRSVKNEVGKVVALLRASGHEVWWDGDIPIMADWWATILSHIEWCEVFIFVASDKSVRSAYCLAELKYASDRQRPVLPFILDDPSSLTLPLELPPRGQWLIYVGDPAQMLAQINVACDNIDWKLYKDIDVPRPPEPMTVGKSLAKQFQEARQLANDLRFEEAKQQLTNIKRLDYGEWGTDCDEWLARLTSYAVIIDLVADESTYERARRAWQVHVREHGDAFDPYEIRAKLRTRHSPNRLRFIIPAAVVVISVILVVILLSRTNQPGGSDSTSPIPSSTTAVAQVATGTPTVSPTLSGFQQLQTAESERTQAAATQNDFNLTATQEAVLSANVTGTAARIAATETAAYATLMALSATATDLPTSTPTSTATSTSEPSEWMPNQTLCIVPDVAWVRSEPSAYNLKFVELNKNQFVSATGENAYDGVQWWWEVRIWNRQDTGWVEQSSLTPCLPPTITPTRPRVASPTPLQPSATPMPWQPTSPVPLQPSPTPMPWQPTSPVPLQPSATPPLLQSSATPAPTGIP